MISSVQGFVNRHRRGLAITAGISGGIYLMGKFAKTKLIEFQEKGASERTAKENMKRRFEQNQQDCVFTVLSFLPTLGDQILHELNVELITVKLQQFKSQRSTPLPTPENSMILPSKPTEKESAMMPTPNRDESQGNKDSEQTERQEVATAAAVAADGQTEEQAQESPKVNGESETQESNSEAPEADAERATVQKDNGIEANGSAPEITVQKEETSEEQSQEPEPKVAQTVIKDEVTAAMDRRTKLELWNELKVMSLTRTITALYSLTFLTLLTQVQLNLLGRFTYISSVLAMTNTVDASYRVESLSTKGSLSSTNGLLDFQTEKKYLTFSYWLLHEGWRRWSGKVREVVEDVVGSTSLKKTFNAIEFSNLIGEIRARLEYTEVDGARIPVNMREYMLPDEESDEREALRVGGVDEFDLIVDPVLRSLLDETRDFIDSKDFTVVLSSSLATTFAQFNLALQPTFNPLLLSQPSGGDSGAVIAEIENEDDVDREVPLVALLPLITRQAHLIINGIPNEYVESLSIVKELQAFSAIIYASFNEQLVNS
ncbi:peroxin [Mortierella polycephala]|uniref:Peroxin n=1 Tax=Mortierella polycephala TaxID=41804 RepID=A0A9P6PXD7_9FUNG|nr:peroxin [Mortierella polycephala]